MPKIDIIRLELVWPGKYNKEGSLVPPRRISLPCQVKQNVNVGRATIAAVKCGVQDAIFDVYERKEGDMFNSPMSFAWWSR